MKNLSFLFFVFCSICGLSQLPSNLKAYFTFNGTLNDSTGFSSPGANYGASPCIDRMGLVNKAYEFNGTGNNIDISSDLNFGTTTIAFWFKPNNITKESIMLSNTANLTNVRTSQIEVRVTPASKLKVWVGNVYLPPSNYREFTSNTSINITKWNHVSVIIDNNYSNIKIYINGVLDQDQAISGLTYTKCLNNMRVGTRFNPTTEDPFDGKVDEVMIFNKALSDAESKSIFAITNGIHKNYEAAFFNVNPNPLKNNQELKLNFMNPITDYSIKIFNIEGKEILYSLVTVDNKLFNLKCENLTTGFYYIRMNIGEISVNKKFVVLN